jgi:hypothetical protein
MTDTVIITNPGATTVHIKLSASTGVTAPNSGSAFAGYFQPCIEVGCWLTGLPHEVTLPPGARQEASFTVKVPTGIPNRQYLAGITAQPATPPNPVPLGSNGNASARALIVDQISLGVAITVGPLARLHTRLEISDVTGGVVGTTPRLELHVRNSGQTFTKAAGKANCTFRRSTRGVPIVMNTVLPNDDAVLPINAPGLPMGTAIQCAVQLHYGAEQLASWSGSIIVPSAHQPPIARTGPGAYSTIPAKTFPLWATALLALAAVTSILLIVVIFLLLRRRNAGATP